MKRKREEIFDQLLEEIKKGKNIDECLRKWPEYADELEPLLAIAQTLTDLPAPEPSEHAVAETLRRVRAVAGVKQKRLFILKPLIAWQPTFVRAAAVVVLIIAAIWTTTSLSAHSLPGEPLYPVKLLTERVEYSVAFNPHRKALLHLRFADRRTEEFTGIFKPGEKIDPRLINAMLNEMQSAFQYAGQCSERRCAVLMQSVAEYNTYQRHVLEAVRARACDCDHEVLDKAISVCHERHLCLECMQTDGTLPEMFAPCWRNECHFE